MFANERVEWGGAYKQLTQNGIGQQYVRIAEQIACYRRALETKLNYLIATWTTAKNYISDSTGNN